MQGLCAARRLFSMRFISPAVAPAEGPHPARNAFFLLLGIIGVLFVTHAWVVDDAYITFRTIDNFVHGLGLRWNVDERVQVYTHPPWMLLFAAVYALTREAFYSVLAFSFLISAAALVVASSFLQREAAPWGRVVFIALLLASKAFLDFSSSGLENPLTNLLLALFFARFLASETAWERASARELAALFGLAALSFVNREDTLLFVAPACAHVLYVQLRAGRRGVIGAAALASVPAVAWLAFSLLYYGSIMPNTAYAKLIGPHIGYAERLHTGVGYFVDSLLIDPMTLPLCVAALVFAALGRPGRERPIGYGLIAYLSYVLVAGAIATHMSGRFFSSAAFLAAFLVAFRARRPAQWLPLVGFSLFVLAVSPCSPMRVGTPWYDRPHVTRRGDKVLDTRNYVLHEGAALLNYRVGVRLPYHAAYRAGEQFRDSPQRVSLGGPGALNMIGYSGYAAGPSKYIIDLLGLSDPLLARLPIARDAAWGPGHFSRSVPGGYVASIKSGSNCLEDPDLRTYYDVIRLITRAPLLSRERLAAIWRFNLGAYDHYVEAYARHAGLRW
jgi:arabinofuranosyltransferase